MAKRGALTGALSGVNEYFDAKNKNRYEMAKMEAQEGIKNKYAMEREKQKYMMTQNVGQPMYGQPGQLTPKQLIEQNEKNRKIQDTGITPNILASLTKGRMTPKLQESLMGGDTEMSVEDELAWLEALARKHGYTKSGEGESVTQEGREGGWFGIGKQEEQKIKYPKYSRNQYQS